MYLFTSFRSVYFSLSYFAFTFPKIDTLESPLLLQIYESEERMLTLWKRRPSKNYPILSAHILFTPMTTVGSMSGTAKTTIPAAIASTVEWLQADG